MQIKIAIFLNLEYHKRPNVVFENKKVHVNWRYDIECILNQLFVS